MSETRNGALATRKARWLIHTSQFLVMFRSRFADAFPAKLAHFGPQDIERGVQGPVPSPEVEGLLCSLLALVLNRKKPVEYVYFTSDSHVCEVCIGRWMTGRLC